MILRKKNKIILLRPGLKIWLGIFLSLILAAILQWNWQNYFFIQTPPLVIFTILLWFWRLNLLNRFWLGALAGIILDSLYALPFGSFILLFFLLAGFIQILQAIISDAEPLLTQTLSFCLCLFLSTSLAYPAWYIIGYVEKHPVRWNGWAETTMFLSGLFWSLVLPIFFFGAIKLWRKFR